MSKFNQAGLAPVHVTTTPTKETYEGAPSFEMDYKLELYQAVATTFLGEGKFYESGDDRAKRITRLVRRCVENGEAEFVAKLAVYVRERMYLRSVPVFLVVTLAKVLREVEGAGAIPQCRVCAIYRDGHRERVHAEGRVPGYHAGLYNWCGRSAVRRERDSHLPPDWQRRPVVQI